MASLRCSSDGLMGKLGHVQQALSSFQQVPGKTAQLAKTRTEIFASLSIYRTVTVFSLVILLSYLPVNVSGYFFPFRPPILILPTAPVESS